MQKKGYTKEEILEYYVNTPFLGNGSYGVEQACQSYFGKSVSDINLAEASIIAGLFQAPSAYDPYRFPEETEKRRYDYGNYNDSCCNLSDGAFYGTSIFYLKLIQWDCKIKIFKDSN